MSDVEVKRGWRLLRYVLGGALCLLAVLDIALGAQWFLGLGVLVVGCVVVLGRRRIFHPGLRRRPDSVICQYVPWYEGNAYVLNVGLPLLGIASVGASYAPGYPAWLRVVGIFILAVTPICTYAAWRMWRRCILCFEPAVLRLRTAERGDVLTDISREQLQAVTPKLIANSVNGVKSLQIEMTYLPEDSSAAPRSVMLGLQLSVQPENLLAALLAWKDGAAVDSLELLDRIDGILRGVVPFDEPAPSG